MIAATRHACAAEPLGPRDCHPVGPLLDADSHLVELSREGRNPIGLLHPELRGIADRGDAASARGCDRERRDLVDESRDERATDRGRSEEHTSELQSLAYLVCRLLLEKKKKRCSS